MSLAIFIALPLLLFLAQTVKFLRKHADFDRLVNGTRHVPVFKSNAKLLLRLWLLGRAH